MEKITQTFNDGVLSIYKVDNISPPGGKPKQGLTFKVGPLHYEERTVGMSRYWNAMEVNAKVQQMLRVPRVNVVNSNDIAIPNDGTQYKILQVQYPKGVEPPCMDLSLEKVVAKFDITDG